MGIVLHLCSSNTKFTKGSFVSNLFMLRFSGESWFFKKGWEGVLESMA